ncbi:putative inorganic phosphate cotransporter [Drosophila kikkawai]|uniref:Inorganic phosphate cotransporter n=1 Tax=Drosophila kikkawai TaxID=30033 RepID=A0A6P4IA87_DROKI|nr:putative inorganic phosphate cotransporter [Drosophila kikkawai]
MENTQAQPDWAIKLSKAFIVPQRWILAIMGFFAIVNAYTMRVCLSQAITVLVIPRNYTDTPKEGLCEADDPSGGPPKSSSGTYDWTQERQGLILASFYIGYLITHVPGGILADKFGGKWTLSLGILATAIFTLITPVTIVYTEDIGLIVLRVLMGLGEGTTFPALSCLLSAWVPKRERGMLGALVLGGGQVGSILGNYLSGLLLHHFDWPWLFYFFGALAILWFLIFTALCYSSPGTHPFIKAKERDYLQGEIPPKSKDMPGTPWKAIFTSVPMWSLISAQIGHDWGFYIMVSCLPKYMADVMRFSIKNNGLYSSLPYMMMWIISLTSGVVADLMINRNCMSITNTRKIMTGFAAYCPAVLMVGASYAGCNRILVVALFTLCMGTMGTYYAGMKLTPLDMSPNYAGVLMAISNGIGSLTGVITPYLVGVMTPNTTMMEWRLVFWVAFVVLVVTAIVYCIWASGEIQPFNDGTNSNKKKTEEPPK